jgi:MFS family permease
VSFRLTKFLKKVELMPITQTVSGAVLKGIGFFKRQPRDWKVTMVRSSIFRFFYQMELPYRSVYIRALGATGTQFGLINSVGMGISGVVSVFTGWAIDRVGVKSIYIIGIALTAVAYLVFGIAQSWAIIIFAMIVLWLGFSTSQHGCSVTCGNSLASEDRATAMSVCESSAAGILGLIAPMLGALLVTTFGGVNANGIRPLFFLALLGAIAAFFLILTQLSDRRWRKAGEASSNPFKDISQLFKHGRYLKRFLIVSSISSLPMGMVLPYIQIFANEIKGADQYVLGAMVSGMSLTPLALGVPIGRLADKIGRKKVLYLTMPFVWASYLVLIWATNPGFLVASGVLHGFFYIAMVITGAMTYELVSPEQMGRWMGVVRLFRTIISATTIYLGGVIWDNIGPQYVFWAIIGLDIFVRIPLLIGMPETLGLQIGNEQ